MSFILDALRKSETERQQQSGGEFSSVPSSSGDAPSHKWLWMLALLLLVNIVILLGVLLRPDGGSQDVTVMEPAPVTQPPAGELARPEPSFEERVATAREMQPATEPPAEVPAPTPVPAAEPAAATPAAPMSERLKTIDELRLEGALQLPDLHLDIHVYAEDPAERFVFINMSKYRENSELDEGPVVVEITAEGVVLAHQGRTFLLPRE